MALMLWPRQAISSGETREYAGEQRRRFQPGRGSSSQSIRSDRALLFQLRVIFSSSMCCVIYQISRSVTPCSIWRFAHCWLISDKPVILSFQLIPAQNHLIVICRTSAHELQRTVNGRDRTHQPQYRSS